MSERRSASCCRDTRGGQIGIPLAGALVGASIASLVLKNPVAPTGVIGIGTVGLFAILVVGRFYGSLATLNAVLLFFGPVCCWLLEVPPRFIGVARLGLVSCLVLIAVVFAGRKFAEDSAARSNSATARACRFRSARGHRRRLSELRHLTKAIAFAHEREASGAEIRRAETSARSEVGR